MKIKTSLLIVAFLVFIGAGLLAFPQASRGAPAATFTLSSTGDAGDLTPGDGVCDADAAAGIQCTLRAAIQEANALPGHDTISFPVSPLSVSPASPLPALTDDAGATIKGTGNIAVIAGYSAGDAAVGLDLQSDNNIVQGLIIQAFDGYGIRVWWSSGNLIGTDGDGTNDAIEKNVIVSNAEGGIFLMGGINRVAGNYIGTNATGTSAVPNGQGIYVEGALDCGTVIGANGDGVGDAVEGNLISGNTSAGIAIHNSCITVAGNKIGVNATGEAGLPNETGIFIWEFADGTLIGTDGDGVSDDLERNIISGNTAEGVGVAILDGEITIAGNYIGTNITGDLALPNDTGIFIDSTDHILVGTNGDGVGDAAEANVISGNTRFGIAIEGEGATANVVAGNKIGADPSGTAAVANLLFGVSLTNGAHHNLIGSDGDGLNDAAERNLISGNAIGIYLGGSNTHENTIAGNYIGVDAAGSAALANTQGGISIQEAWGNTIGGLAGNLISGNGSNGVKIAGETAQANHLAGNKIGLNAGGSAAVPNLYGVYVVNAPQNIIGTDGDGSRDSLERNIISGNSNYGVYLHDAESSGTIVAGNYIGVSAGGLAAVPNNFGVKIVAAPDSRIGTDGDGVSDVVERNVISGNYANGIDISESASGTIIAGNYIGIDANGSAGLKNGMSDWGTGVSIYNAPNTLIGTDADGVADAAERNIISGNNTGGVSVTGELSYGTVIAGNYIGTNAVGEAAVPNGNTTLNGDQAILVMDAAVRIGTNGDGLYDAAERNVISGNYGFGINVMGTTADTLIAGNYIGVDAGGYFGLGNSKSGVMINTGYLVTIGGIAQGMANIIAYNGGDGVTIGSDPASTSETDILVRGNSIYFNSDLGIDLGDDGVTANDPGDADSGPNKLQNYPLLTSAQGGASTTTVAGSLHSLPSTTYWLDFYANPNGDDSGYGEGELYLGSHTVTTDASGNADFSVELPAAVASGYQISAAAMAADKGSTSEFSQCLTVEITEFWVYLPLAIH